MNHKVMTICAVAREVCVAAWAKVTNAQNEHSDSLLGSFGHQAARLKVPLWDLRVSLSWFRVPLTPLVTKTLCFVRFP